ncbi:MAG: prolipoprotein diacylglyceryl transferase [Eggerthellaceae bacterium]|nr:prolipoprotein diacylglyceryl transferase [Eggerthellaceae bacterium]
MLNELFHSLDPVAFTVGPFAVRWYGIAYVLGFIFAGIIIYRVAKRWRINVGADQVSTIIMWIIIGVILGARLGYVLFYGGDYYVQNPEKILMFNEGGMSFHGGLLGAVLGGFIASRQLKMPFITVADLCTIGAPIGLFFGRCANFVNGELWGAETSLPWGVVFGGFAGDVPRHPTQLYEACLEGIVLFVVLYVLARKLPPRPRGTFLGTFLLLYGIFRFLIEFVRQPDAHIGYLAGDWLTMGQVLSFPLVLAGIALLVWANHAKLPQQGVEVADNNVS